MKKDLNKEVEENSDPEIEILFNGENVLDFWTYDEKGNPKLLQGKLMKFLGRNGFVNITQNNRNIGLVQELNNRIKKSTVEMAVQLVKEHLERKALDDIYEVFAKGVGSYLSRMKLNLLKSIEIINDRDQRNSSRFYFHNCFIDISDEDFQIKPYKELDTVIWENRIINKEFVFPSNNSRGQFETFCFNICKKDEERFLAFKTMLGYLLHRNTERGEDVAVILYDENMGGSRAEGGTGKTLLSTALNHCRDRVEIGGKQLKMGSNFAYQRVDYTTDIIVFEDFAKSVSLEPFFDMITGGMEVEKKMKQAFYISRKMMPKIMFTSNYLIKGPKGSSTRRRKYEFELANYYNDWFRPEHEFKNRFFDDLWSKDEWNKFFYFMMTCIQDYLEKGLVKAAPINFNKVRMADKSSDEFIDFMDENLEYNKWIDKRFYQELFEDMYPDIEKVSSKMFGIWLNDYAHKYGGEYETKSTGSKYYFIVRIKKVNDEEK